MFRLKRLLKQGEKKKAIETRLWKLENPPKLKAGKVYDIKPSFIQSNPSVGCYQFTGKAFCREVEYEEYYSDCVDGIIKKWRYHFITENAVEINDLTSIHDFKELDEDEFVIKLKGDDTE